MNLKKTRLITSLLIALPIASQAAPTPQLEAVAEPTAAEQQALGLGVGTLVGALAGPVGAVAGAALGSLIGWSQGLEENNQQLQAQAEVRQRQQQQLVAALNRSQQEKQQALTQQESFKHQLASYQPPAGNTDYAPLLAYLHQDLHFQTASAEIEPHYRPGLQKLAQSLAAYPDIRLRLTGYADPRGSVPNNQQLAGLRVDAVRALLIDAGLDGARISSVVLGERGSIADLQPARYPLDRRVRMQIQKVAENSEGALITEASTATASGTLNADESDQSQEAMTL